MTKELEDRIAKLEIELKQASGETSANTANVRHRSFPLRKTLIVLSAVVVILGSSWYFFVNRPDASGNFLPADIISQVDYPLYIPEKLPNNYAYKKDSADIQEGVVFYTLTNGSSDISMTSQPKPSSNLDLEITDGLKPFNVPSGKAYTGLQGTTPVTIFVTDQSLVIATGQSATAASDLEAIISSLQPVQD